MYFLFLILIIVLHRSIIVFRVKEMSNSSFIKLITSVIAVFLFSASTADQKPSIELAQLSDGLTRSKNIWLLVSPVIAQGQQARLK